MTLSPAFLDELRARTTLSAVIAPSVKLTKAGREYKACCPFHSEKTPSFTVNDDKGFYHCFGCGAHGDAIRFLTDARGLPFIDAVKELAGKAGMELPAQDPRDREKHERAVGLHEVMAAAQKWFADQLAGAEGGAARAYLAQRGIDAAATLRFGIGFAPDHRGKLKTALAHFGEDRLVDTGMLIRPDEPGKPAYDRFRGRLMIPIRDPRGRVIAFGGRILGPGEPKYLNSPDTPLFDKGRTLYNLDLASPASRAAGRVIVVEGYMDVIALDRAGIGEAVAPNGTALTEAQLERLWRLEPAPICCFDGDSAGQKAAIRASLRALPHLAPERTLRFVTLPPGQDPDDLVKSGGPAAINAVLESAEPLVERLWRHEVEALPLDTPEARAGLKARLLDHVGAIGDSSVRQLYRDEWLRRFDALVRPDAQRGGGGFTPRKPWKKNRDGRFVPPEAPPGAASRSIGQLGIDPVMVRPLLAGCLRYPHTLREHLEDIASFVIAEPRLRGLRDELIQFALTAPSLDFDTLQTTLAASEHDSLAKTLLRADGMRFSFNRKDADPHKAVRDFEAVLSALVERGSLERAFDQATADYRADVSDEHLVRQQQVRAAIADLDNRLASLAGNE